MHHPVGVEVLFLQGQFRDALLLRAFRGGKADEIGEGVF